MGSDESGTEERFEALDNTTLHASRIGNDGIGTEVRGDACGDRLERPDRGAEDDEIGIRDRLGRIAFDGVGQIQVPDFLESRGIASPDGEVEVGRAAFQTHRHGTADESGAEYRDPADLGNPVAGIRGFDS
jgi:hypothetical protein